jgi:glycogen(starch) synthase
MKIIILSLSYLPNVGGLENIMAGLAEEWSNGHDVTVYTIFKGGTTEENYPYKIVRDWSFITLWKAITIADVFIEANISLKTFWIGLLNRKKWIVIHHTCYAGHQNVHFDTIKDNIRNNLTCFSKNIACSYFVESSLKGKSIVIPNFYYNQTFKIHSVDKIPNSLIFLGRLVSDKGVDLLLEALFVLKQQGKKYQLTIIGKGPEEFNLKTLVNQLELQDTVFFKGILKDEALALELNKHKVMVIPSRWKEPFGIVALEGLACGCKIVCPDEGGLKEAAGPSSYLYRHNDLESLINAIEQSHDSLLNIKNATKVQAHLKRHSKGVIAKKYLNYIKSTLGDK